MGAAGGSAVPAGGVTDLESAVAVWSAVADQLPLCGAVWGQDLCKGDEQLLVPVADQCLHTVGLQATDQNKDHDQKYRFAVHGMLRQAGMPH